MKHLYVCTPEKIIPYECSYEIHKETPRLFKAYPTQKLSLKVTAHNMYWWLITQGRYRVWCAYDGKRVVHTSYVIPNCFKFPFLKKGDFEIGPCFTEKDYRGKSIYPAVLSRIVSESGKAYMIINDANTSSIRGVIKAGFYVEPGEIKCDKMKRYLYMVEK